ncbi:MAG: hypothetical protein H0V76_08125 [Blastocatellia bacterium]|nr:hypothetical protein [Blastocatellia bacterium]
MTTKDEQNPNLNKFSNNGHAGLFELQMVNVVLTYELTTPATRIVFPMRPTMTEEELADRQRFYALSEDEITAGRHKWNCQLLEKLTDAAGVEGIELNGQSISEFFSGPDPNGMKTKVVQDALNRYNTMTQPAEFFR